MVDATPNMAAAADADLPAAEPIFTQTFLDTSAAGLVLTRGEVMKIKDAYDACGGLTREQASRLFQELYLPADEGTIGGYFDTAGIGTKAAFLGFRDLVLLVDGLKRRFLDQQSHKTLLEREDTLVALSNSGLASDGLDSHLASFGLSAAVDDMDDLLAPVDEAVLAAFKALGGKEDATGTPSLLASEGLRRIDKLTLPFKDAIRVFLVEEGGTILLPDFAAMYAREVQHHETLGDSVSSRLQQLLARSEEMGTLQKQQSSKSPLLAASAPQNLDTVLDRVFPRPSLSFRPSYPSPPLHPSPTLPKRRPKNKQTVQRTTQPRSALQPAPPHVPTRGTPQATRCKADLPCMSSTVFRPGPLSTPRSRHVINLIVEPAEAVVKRRPQPAPLYPQTLGTQPLPPLYGEFRLHHRQPAPPPRVSHPVMLVMTPHPPPPAPLPTFHRPYNPAQPPPPYRHRQPCPPPPPPTPKYPSREAEAAHRLTRWGRGVVSPQQRRAREHRVVREVVSVVTAVLGAALVAQTFTDCMEHPVIVIQTCYRRHCARQTVRFRQEAVRRHLDESLRREAVVRIQRMIRGCRARRERCRMANEVARRREEEVRMDGAAQRVQCWTRGWQAVRRRDELATETAVRQQLDDRVAAAVVIQQAVREHLFFPLMQQELMLLKAISTLQNVFRRNLALARKRELSSQLSAVRDFEQLADRAAVSIQRCARRFLAVRRVYEVQHAVRWEMLRRETDEALHDQALTALGREVVAIAGAVAAVSALEVVHIKVIQQFARCVASTFETADRRLHPIALSVVACDEEGADALHMLAGLLFEGDGVDEKGESSVLDLCNTCSVESSQREGEETASESSGDTSLPLEAALPLMLQEHPGALAGLATLWEVVCDTPPPPSTIPSSPSTIPSPSSTLSNF